MGSHKTSKGKNGEGTRIGLSIKTFDVGRPLRHKSLGTTQKVLEYIRKFSVETAQGHLNMGMTMGSEKVLIIDDTDAEI